MLVVSFFECFYLGLESFSPFQHQLKSPKMDTTYLTPLACGMVPLQLEVEIRYKIDKRLVKIYLYQVPWKTIPKGVRSLMP